MQGSKSQRWIDAMNEEYKSMQDNDVWDLVPLPESAKPIGSVLYSNNNRSSSKSKYIDIKFLVVKEKVQSGQISIEHIGTNYMIADPLTKGLSLKVFHEHTAHIGIVLYEDIVV
ncbi:hypothetical protein ACOSQ2_003044 [Xanthoceras sorbifolium]